MTTLHMRYGNFRHEPGEVEYSRTVTTDFDAIDRPLIIRERWDLQGWIVGTSTADVQAKYRRLAAAYSIENQSIGMWNGGNPTDVYLDRRNTISGVKVIQRPSLPDNRNAAYVTFLPYAITLEAELAANGNANMMVEFEESLEFEGGGPAYGHIETLDTLPIKQRRRAATVYRAVQRGRAVALRSRPLVPAPLWPSELMERPRISKPSPRRRGNDVIFWPIEWSYVFESAQPMFGEPNYWGFA